MQLEEKIKALKKARKIADGEKLTIRRYEEIRKEHNLRSKHVIMENHKWNEIKSIAFEEEFKLRNTWTMEEAIKAGRAARKEYKKLTSKNYDKYAENHDVPSSGFIMYRYRWKEFLKLLDGQEAKRKDEQLSEVLFCRNCADKEECEIELEDCEYWKEWNNEKVSSM